MPIEWKRITKLIRKPRPVYPYLFAAAFTILLIYTRTVNLAWGLPYPMHPDERNMAVSIMQMECPALFAEGCLDPGFFAYGQFPLYSAWFLVTGVHFLSGTTGKEISFEEATMALRFISASAAVGTGWFLWLALRNLVAGKKTRNRYDIRFLVLLSVPVVFTPALIQFAHFGTTESLLMLFYTAIAYYSLRLIAGKLQPLPYTVIAGLITGLSLATKISALPYVVVPVLALILSYRQGYRSKSVDRHAWLRKQAVRIVQRAGLAALFGGIAALAGVIGSPYNWLKFDEFMGSISYESGVGLGTSKVFYTRSFEFTAPVFFQFGAIIPYALGIPLFLLSVAGFLFLPWRHRGFILLRIMFLLYFLPQAAIYAKWTRFIAPVFPLLVLFAITGLSAGYNVLAQRWPAGIGNILVRAGAAILVLLVSIPGIAMLRIYTEPDIRYTASEWIYRNIPDGAYILAETANVIDIPILPPDAELPLNQPNFTYISFDFYHVDSDPLMRLQLEDHLARADYIFVNSRRVFKNHTCITAPTLRAKPLISLDQRLPVPLYVPLSDQQERCRSLAAAYPQLHEYYDRLFHSGEYRLVAEFASFPGISIGGFPLLELPDENAEETWTVFDHPVIRIYHRVRN